VEPALRIRVHSIPCPCIQLGPRRGISAREVLSEFEEVTSLASVVRSRLKRHGDPLAVWASNERALKDMVSTPKESLQEIIASCIQVNGKQ
jgi:UDP-glucose 4-epimerase